MGERERAVLAAKRRQQPPAAMKMAPPERQQREMPVPGYSERITDAFCDPAIARAADPGVIAEHAMRFMKLKRRFRSKEMGGPGRGRRDRSVSTSRGDSRSRTPPRMRSYHSR